MSYDGPFPQVVRAGGSGAATLTGVLTGNGISAFTVSALTQNAVLYGGASNLISSTAVGSTGTVLQGNTGAAPTYSTATYPSTTNLNRILYSTNDNVVGQLATASNSTFATNLTGTPALVSLNTNGALLIGSTGAGGPVGAVLTQGSGISITNGAGSITLAVDGAAVGQTITGDSGGALSPTAGNWTLAGSGSIATSGSGSTLTTALTGLTNHAVLVGAGTSTITKLAVGTTGQLLVGATGADPAFGSSASADFTFTTTTAGAVRTLTISNTNNSNSGSRAVLQTTTGGASSGDPYHVFTITGVTDWAMGVDNSQSDIFAIAPNDTLGSGNVFTISTAGAVSCIGGNFDTTRSASGADVSVTASNTSNTASSTATLYATVAGTSANDPRTQYAVGATTTWTQGIDNSDSDAFVTSASTALGTTNVMRMSTAGEVTSPLQPAFLAYRSANVSNVTGAGTVYTPVFDSEIFDQGGDYNAASGIFTAPVTGRYHFSFGVGMFGLAVTMTDCTLALVTSNRTYNLYEGNPFVAADPGASQEFIGSTYADMDANDTAIVNITISNAAGDTADLDGGSAPTRSFFGGKLTA